jgi:ribonuclease P protein component
VSDPVSTDDRSEAHRRRRLSKSGDFDRVYREGRSRGNRFLVLYSFADSERGPEGPRLGISVGRRLGKAVQRNRVKRAIREAFWSLVERLPAGRDYVVVARPGAEKLVEREGTDGVRASLEELLDRPSEDPGEGV